MLSTLPQYLLLPSLPEWQFVVEGHQLQCYGTFWLRGHVENEKNSYLHFLNTYDRQIGRVITYHDGPHPLIHLTIWSCGHPTNEKRFICTFAILMVTKHGRVVTCCGGPQLQSHVAFLQLSHVTNKKKLISAYLQYLWPLKLTEW